MSQLKSTLQKPLFRLASTQLISQWNVCVCMARNRNYIYQMQATDIENSTMNQLVIFESKQIHTLWHNANRITRLTHSFALILSFGLVSFMAFSSFEIDNNKQMLILSNWYIVSFPF